MSRKYKDRCHQSAHQFADPAPRALRNNFKQKASVQNSISCSGITQFMITFALKWKPVPPPPFSLQPYNLQNKKLQLSMNNLKK